MGKHWGTFPISCCYKQSFGVKLCIPALSQQGVGHVKITESKHMWVWTFSKCGALSLQPQAPHLPIPNQPTHVLGSFSAPSPTHIWPRFNRGPTAQWETTCRGFLLCFFLDGFFLDGWFSVFKSHPWGWEGGLVTKRLPSVCEAMSLSPSTPPPQKKEKQKSHWCFCL